VDVSTVLRYARLITRAGVVLVVMSECGLVDVVRAEHETSAEGLRRSVQERFPTSRLIPDHGVHADWAAAVASRIDGRRTDFAAPLDVGRCVPVAV
jgi:hypothetical protein